MSAKKFIYFTPHVFSRGIFACLFTLAIGISVPSLSAQSDRGTITGKVINETTGLPLEGAAVSSLNGGSLKTTTTGADGS